ncbi:MAG: hypothetical protein N2318_04055 [Meiothermus sp.]|nr:hypothetical protein [Meiothermus sp.]
MKTLSWFQAIVLAFGIVLLSACSSPNTGPMQELAVLADSSGNLEATLEMASLGLSGVKAALGDTGTHEVGHFMYKGKPLHGLITQISFPSLWAKGSRIQVRGRLQNVKGVTVFVGAAVASNGQQTDLAGIILMSANKSLPSVQTVQRMPSEVRGATYQKIEWVYIVQPSPELEEIVFFRSENGMVGLGSPTAPTGLPKGQPILDTSMNCEATPQQTVIGPVGNASCTWKGPNFGTDKNIIAILIG